MPALIFQVSKETLECMIISGHLQLAQFNLLFFLLEIDYNVLLYVKLLLNRLKRFASAIIGV